MKNMRLVIASLIAVSVAVFACAPHRHSTGPSGVVREGGTYVTNLAPVEKEGGLDLSVEASGKLQYTIFKLENPKRVVIDMPDTDVSAFTAPIDLTKGVAWQVTSHYFPQVGNSRIEISIKEAVTYTVTRQTDNKVIIGIRPFAAVAEAATPERALAAGETEITGIDLRDVTGLARVIIPYKGEKPRFEMTRKREMNRITLDIHNAKITKANEKLLTVEAKGSLLKNVAVFQFTTNPSVVKVIANLNEFTSSNVFEKEGNILFDIGPDAILAQASMIKEEKKDKNVDLTTRKEKLPGDYEGRKISLDFQSADIRNILRIIADVSGMNVITSEKVAGKVSMKLVEVPWDMALEIILKNNNLGMVRTGNIIRIATIDELSKEKEVQASDKQTVEKVESLYLKVFPVNYESSAKLKANLDAIKSVRGTIDVNERTNTLIIKDTKDRLAEMEKLIEVLDKRTVQVLIEARIVEVSHTHVRELGIKWGGTYTASVGGSRFPATVGLSGLASGAQSSAAGGIVNLGTSGAASGALGVRLGSVDSTALLDMQLMALQTNGLGRILSMPKISTMNNIEALIESGREIPYQTTSSAGTQTAFKKATLQLKVTPHVTDDNFIRLEIEANKDEADFANQLPNSPPPILTKHAKTVVLIKDGDTTVIGGMFKESKTESEAGVPFFSKIPVLGWLFKSRADSNSGEELLIFITPKVL